jgi:hypothetical protein
MHSHENPIASGRKILLRNAALQIGAGCIDELTMRAAGEAPEGMLYLICSI